MMARSEESLLELCLEEAKLGQYAASLQEKGVTSLEMLASMSMQEYDSLGVTPTEDKKQLFRLIHTIRNLDLNKLSDMQGEEQQVACDENSNSKHPDTTTLHRKNGHHGNKKAVKNQHNKSAQSGNAQQHHHSPTSRNEASDSMRRDGIVMMRDVPRNGILNRTFDKEDEADQSGQEIEGHRKDESLHVEIRQILHDADDNAVDRVQVIEYSQTSYNYGVPSASPATPGQGKLGSKTATSFVGHLSQTKKADSDVRIRVCVRKRPMNQREWRAGEGDAVTAEGSTSVLVKERKVTVDLTKVIQVHKYHFDEVFHESCSNEDVYERTAKPLIATIFKKGTATCFAYGQTGAGKTHTLLGEQGSKVKGLYLLAAEDVFATIRESFDGPDFVVCVSYFEIYCGQIFDLLNRRERLHARENANHKVCITGLNEVRVNGPTSLMQVIENGNQVRVVGASGVNADSSRSHAILQIQLKDKAGNQIGKLSFIDLAGSERACDTSDPDKVTRQEGAEINTSLLALKECIRALDQEKRHTPFRQSKLTQVLRDSFLGQSRTCMIACVSPNASAVDHTLNTLRYADRVKELRQADNFGDVPTTPSNSSTSIKSKHPPTPTTFSPSSSSTPVKTKTKTKKSVEYQSHTFPRKKKGDSSKKKSTATTPTESKASFDDRGKRTPDPSPSKSGYNVNSAGRLPRKSSSHHNLQRMATMNGQSTREERTNNKLDVSERYRRDQASGHKSPSVEKKPQSSIKVRENRTLEERKMRALVNRSRTEDLSQSVGNETPSKRTPEVRARMKKAFLNSSLPVWDTDQQRAALSSPSNHTSRPKKLEFENPRFVASPSHERAKENESRSAEPMPEMSNSPLRFDVPNPRFKESPGNYSVHDVESGYIPDVDNEIETPRSDQGEKPSNHNSGATADQSQGYQGELRRESSNSEEAIEGTKTPSPKSLQLQETNETMEGGMDTSAYFASLSSSSNKRDKASKSGGCQPLNLSESSSTAELLAEIERSLQRSPVGTSPVGTEPWMRVISEDKLHGRHDAPTDRSTRRDPKDTKSSDQEKQERTSSRKELFRSGKREVVEAWEPPHQNDSQSSTPTQKTASGKAVHSRGLHRTPHVHKEKLDHAGFAKREIIGSASPCTIHSEDLQRHTGSAVNKEDRPVPVGQQTKEMLPKDDCDSAPSQRTLSSHESKGSSLYATPAESQSGQRHQRVLTSSTPKAFRHESLGMDASHLHLSFSTIQSTTLHCSEQSASEPNESFTTATEDNAEMERGEHHPDGSGGLRFENNNDLKERGQVQEEVPCGEVVFPVSPRVTLSQSRSEGQVTQHEGHVTKHAHPGQGGHAVQGLSPGQEVQEKPQDPGARLKVPQRPAYKRQNSASERASTHYFSPSPPSPAHVNHAKNTRELLLAAHAEQLEETLRLCEAGWTLIGMLRSRDMEVEDYMTEAGDLLDSQSSCIDTFRDQLASFTRCTSPRD